MSFARGLKDLVTGFQNSGGTDAIYKAIERKRQESEFAKLVDALQNQSQTRTVEEKQQINNPLAQGIINPLMNAASQAFNPVQDITTQKEVPLSPQEIQRAMIEKLGQYYGQGGNNPMAGSLAQTYMPKQPENVTLGEGAVFGQVGADGKFNKIAENLKDFPPQKPEKPEEDKKIDSYTGADGFSHTVFMKPDGNTYEKTGEGKVREPKGTNINVNTAKDVTADDIVGEISTTLSYIQNTGEGKLPDNEKQIAMSQLIGKTDQLMDKAGLTGETPQLWTLVNKGYSVPQAIGTINALRTANKQPELTAQQKNYINIFFKARKF